MVMVDQVFYKNLYSSLEHLDVLSFLKWIPELVVDEDSKREMEFFLGTTYNLKSGPLDDMFIEFPWYKVSDSSTKRRQAVEEAKPSLQDNVSLVGTTSMCEFVHYMQPPTTTAEFNRDGKSPVSCGGSVKRRISSGYGNHAKKRQAVEEHDVSFVQTPVDVCISSPVQPTNAPPSGKPDLAWNDPGTYIQYTQPPTPTADHGSAKRRRSSRFENHAKKGQAVEANRDVSLQNFAPSMSIAPADTCIFSGNLGPSMLDPPADVCITSPVQPTKALPFIQYTPWLFDSYVDDLMPPDIRPDGSEPVSAFGGLAIGNIDSAWNEDPVWQALCDHEMINIDHISSDTLDEVWAQYIRWPDM